MGFWDEIGQKSAAIFFAVKLDFDKMGFWDEIGQKSAAIFSR